MRLAIDAVAANEKIRTGAGEYAFRLLTAMMKETSSSEGVFLYTESPLHEMWPQLPENWKSRVLPWPVRGWVGIRLNAELITHKPDVAFFPSSGIPLFAPPRRDKSHASVATVHDIGFDRLPQLYAPVDRRRQRHALHGMIKKCAHLFAVSEFTKSELTHLHHLDSSRITVTPLGVNEQLFQKADPSAVDRIRQTYHLSRHYFLFVSRVDAKKNVEGLVRAFTIFKEARGFGDPHELVIAGPPGFGFPDLKALVESSSVRSSIHLIGPVSEEEKIALYTGALGYVNLSWYEGFGLTPLEAAACGTPSLLSDIPAHREVMSASGGGEGALYVSPKAPEEIAMVWKRFAEDAILREKILESARGRLKLFSWERSAKDTWEILRGVLSPDTLFTPKPL
ncbi:TPA: hypothetical protein DDZ10_03080 [Candidatus Uhrbacteria bacterium]|nr:MAG: Glycosyl transferase, group 1 [Parcubacteria group bacterium GW2011_GWA2_53_21]OGL72048.1 MAG: hypothetical protein A3D69_00790 [Candidatus Uhrbacteria bacterium RIFCSPHIGHO2_02_FULL_54_11]HBL39632.1 hypothetical protein [Candidatus Uhrbacteria bacterium]